MLRPFVLIILAPSVLLLSSCTNRVHPEIAGIQRPLIDPIPLTVGVYYAPEFRSYEHTVRRGFLATSRDDSWSLRTFKFSLGPPSVALFDRVLANLFESVIIVASRPPWSGEAPMVDGVLEPRIVRFEPGDIDLPGSNMSIIYGITLYSPQGDQLASWMVTGRPVRLLNAARAASEAMRAAVAQLIIGFRKQHEVHRWIDNALDAPGAGQ